MNVTGDNWSAGFVSDGAVVLRELGYEGMIPPIPDGESAVLALAPGKLVRVYGLTKGPKSHFFVYNDAPMEDCVLRLGVIAENVSSGDLVCASDGNFFGAVSGEDGKGKFHSTMFRHDPSKDQIGSELQFTAGTPEKLKCPFDKQKVLKLAIDRCRDVIYGLLAPENVLFSYDLKGGEFRELARIGGERISRVLCVDNAGAVYGFADDGKLFRFDPKDARLERTEIEAPAGKGKEYINTVSAARYDHCTNVIWGGTLVDGLLFRIRVENGQVTCFGKPIEQRHIRCLTIGNDGTLYGVAGEPGTGICHLFRFDPQNCDVRDLGIPRLTISKCWVSHEIDTICTNRNGHIIMGENDRMSHLMVYYPPIGRRSL